MVSLPQKYCRTLLFLLASQPTLCSPVGEVLQEATYHPKQLKIKELTKFIYTAMSIKEKDLYRFFYP